MTPNPKLQALFAAALFAATTGVVTAQSSYEYRKPVPSLNVAANAGPQDPAPTPPPPPPPAPPPPGPAPAPAPAELQLSSGSVNFGSVAAGASATRQIAVTNTGGSPLTWSSVPQVQGNLEFAAGSTTCSGVLNAGQTCLTDVVFSPASVGTFNGQLVFTSALASSPHEVTLLGTAFNPVSLSPATLSQATVGQAYSADLRPYLAVSTEASPDLAQASWSVLSDLPAGLSLNSQTGIVSGTPVSAAQSSVPVQVTYKANKATATYVLTVAPETDPYWNAVSLLMNFEGTAGTTTLSEPTKGLALTFYGSAQLSGTSKFGNTSLSITNGYVRMPGARFALGTRPFTFEAFVRRSATTGNLTLLETRPDNTNGPYITLSVLSSGAINYYTSTALRIEAPSGTVPMDGNWHHIAYSRDNAGIGRLFFDGTKMGVDYVDNNNYIAASTVAIGRNAYGTTQSGGLVDALRLTDGVGRYTTNFAPPSNPYVTAQ